MTISPPSTTSKKKSTSKPKNGDSPLPTSPEPSTELLDPTTRSSLEEQFTRGLQQQSEKQLIENHLKKLEAEEVLHQNRLQAIWAQLQIQLFQLWNEVWLQSRKVHDQAHKEWLKLFLS